MACGHSTHAADAEYLIDDVSAMLLRIILENKVEERDQGEFRGRRRFPTIEKTTRSTSLVQSGFLMKPVKTRQQWKVCESIESPRQLARVCLFN